MSVVYKAVAASSEAFSRAEIETFNLELDLGTGASLRKAPDNEYVDYILFVENEEALKGLLISYSAAHQRVGGDSILVVVPKLETLDELTTKVIELVVEHGNYITDDPETFDKAKVEVSSEGFKEIVDKVIAFFTPLPKDHINKVTKQVTRSLQWSADTNEQNALLTVLLDGYLDNKDWLAQQSFKKGLIKHRSLTSITNEGKLDINTLPEDIASSLTAVNELNSDFAPLALDYTKALNKKIPYVEVALLGASTVMDPESPVVNAACSIALTTLESTPSPLKFVNFKNYSVLGYHDSRGVGLPPKQYEIVKSYETLTEATYAQAVKALRAIISVTPVEIEESQFALEQLSHNVVEAIQGNQFGEDLIEFLTPYGYYHHSGWSKIPDPFKHRFNLVVGLLNLMLGSLTIKQPRSLENAEPK